MPPQVRHTKVRDIQIRYLHWKYKSHTVHIPLRLFTYINWSYIYIDTRVHCASVGIMYTAALIRKSLTKTLL